MSKRRGNNEGTLTERADGRWMGRVSLPNGKRKSVYGRTRAEASAKMKKTQRDVDRGMPVANERMTVGLFLDEWLEKSVKPSVRPATYESYEGHVRNHLKPSIGRIKLARLTPRHVESLWSEKREAGLSASTILRIRATLRRALNQAIKWDLVGRNAAAIADAPKAERPRFEPMSPDAAKTFLRAAEGDRLEALYHLVLACGLRRGEALGLSWGDVDLDARTLAVRQSLQRIDGRLQLVPPKTRESVRSIPFVEGVAAKLREHRARQGRERLLAGDRWTESGLVFTTKTGTPLDGTNVTRYFQRVLSRAGLPRIRFHDLRHACATYLLSQGVGLNVIKEILGHSQIGLTADTYAHVLPSLKSDAAERIGGLLWGEEIG